MMFYTWQCKLKDLISLCGSAADLCLNCRIFKCLCISAEAEEKYGADNLKIYQSAFTPMYYAMTENKVKCTMKLICLLPQEKVFLCDI